MNLIEESSKSLFNTEYNEILVHQVLITYIWKMHYGSKKQKSRSEVRGGGKKPWNQKGSGRARVGSIRSPIWRGGGVIFATKRKKKEKKINKKMYRLCIKMILDEMCREEKVSIIKKLNVDSLKTKDIFKLFQEKRRSLIILNNFEDKLYKVSKNIKNINLIKYTQINPLILLKNDNLLFLEECISPIQKLLS